jgi:O-antigen/teichoic acid export membrane protein
MMKSTQSLKWNASANFLGLGYTTIIGVAILPLYLQYLGAEAFGLVGFFMVLQAWMQIFDMGMSPLLSRQAAQARGENAGYLGLRRLLRSLELIIVSIALLIFASMAAGSVWITNNWLNVASLDSGKVANCLVLMGAIIGLRFLASLYRSGIQGMENQVLLNVANIVLVSVKFVGALLLMRFLTQDIFHFFVYQLCVGFLELVVVATMVYRFIPGTDTVGFALFWGALKPVLPFAGGIAYTAAIWVLLTQLDKLVLSNVLPLSEYGYFSIVAIVATGISQIGAPISQAILPRMTFLLSQGDEEGMLTLYRQATQLMAVMILPFTVIVAFFSTELLFAWTGDRAAAEWAGPVLLWFALGNGILAIGAFQFYLQFAHGKLRMHVIFNSILVALQIPLIVYAAYRYGVMAVAMTWFALRLLSFIIWTPIVHKRFAHGIHWSWLLRDIGPSFAMTVFLLLFVISLDFPFDQLGRLGVFATLIGVGLLMLLCNTLVSRAPRNLLVGTVKRRFANED